MKRPCYELYPYTDSAGPTPEERDRIEKLLIYFDAYCKQRKHWMMSDRDEWWVHVEWRK